MKWASAPCGRFSTAKASTAPADKRSRRLWRRSGDFVEAHRDAHGGEPICAVLPIAPSTALRRRGPVRPGQPDTGLRTPPRDRAFSCMRPKFGLMPGGSRSTAPARLASPPAPSGGCPAPHGRSRPGTPCAVRALLRFPMSNPAASGRSPPVTAIGHRPDRRTRAAARHERPAAMRPRIRPQSSIAWNAALFHLPPKANRTDDPAGIPGASGWEQTALIGYSGSR